MKGFISGLFFFVVWSISFDTSAQLTESDTLRLGYRVNANGSWITGNVERLLLNSNLDLSHVGEIAGVKSSNSYIYGTIFNNKTENDIFSRNFFYLYPRERFYPYVMLWLQNSRRQQIKFRYQAGLGASYGLVHNAATQLKLSVTLTHEETRYTGEDFTVEPENLNVDRIKNWRGTIRVLGNHYLANKKIRLHYETWYQPAADDKDNWRTYVHAVVEVPLSRHFAFRSALLYMHDNIVLVPIKRDDKIVTFGVNFSNF